MSDAFASLSEDLTADPLQAAIQAALRQQIEQGADPKDLVHSAFVAAAALSVDVNGLARTALYMLKIGSTFAGTSPEIAGVARQLLAAIDLTKSQLDQNEAPITRTDH